MYQVPTISIYIIIHNRCTQYVTDMHNAYIILPTKTTAARNGVALSYH